jgi:hypothetical protein
MHIKYKANARGLLAVVFAAVVPFYAHLAFSQSVSDTQVKALYLYKITKFLTWDGSGKQPIRFCYMESSGADEDASVGQQLTNYIDKKGKKDVQVIHLRNLQEMDSCHILFIPSSEQSAIGTVISKASGKDILTVSDAKRFIYSNGMVGFVTDEQNRVQMEANLRNIKSTKIRISAAALEVMAEVIQ